MNQLDKKDKLLNYGLVYAKIFGEITDSLVSRKWRHSTYKCRDIIYFLLTSITPKMMRISAMGWSHINLSCPRRMEVTAAIRGAR